MYVYKSINKGLNLKKRHLDSERDSGLESL